MSSINPDFLVIKTLVLNARIQESGHLSLNPGFSNHWVFVSTLLHV